MRILLWSDLFWPYIGGVEKVTADLMTDLQERGFEFMSVSSHHYLTLPDRDAFQGIPVRRFPFIEALQGRDLVSTQRLKAEMVELKKAFRPDLVHLQSIGANAFFHFLSEAGGRIPMIVSLQQDILEMSERTMVARALHKADWVTAVSAELLARARSLVPAIATRSSVIHNFESPPAHAPRPLPFHPPCLVCLGRVIAQKGFDLALRVFPRILESIPQARLIIAGDGDERPALEEMAGRLGIAGQVEFRGWVAPDRVMEFLNAATVVVMPSRFEGLPVVAIQAALMARPVVASSAMGMSEVVVHGRTGVLCEKESPEALGEALLRLLTDPDGTARMGRAARQHALKHFTRNHCVNQYRELYARLGEKSAVCL